jgi:hypothetical protein
MKKKSVTKVELKYLNMEGMNEEEDCDDLLELE